MSTRTPLRGWLAGSALLAALSASQQPVLAETAPQAAEQKAVDFATQIRPILSTHCAGCHGAGDQQGGLRLDHREPAFRGGDSGEAIVPHHSGKSELVRRITSEDESEQMPPAGEGTPLSKEQVALVRTWIEQGAIWPEEGEAAKVTSSHWAYQPRRPGTLPDVKNAAWARNPIDRYILARLEAANVAPSPEADRVTLIKRLSYDLIGLPPTLEEVDEFLADTSPDAYERLVDQLLASPHYGERWGRHWLDKARYADSDGYEKDNPRPDAWRFRDWVIDALNRDLPFEQFTIEQLAGDLLPNATEDQRIATAFHRQTLTNTEGGVDKEEFRVVAVIDRANTTAAVWLGLTAGCAQCHTHKYDQITQAEYYQLYAFFNNGDEIDLERSLGPDAEARYAQQLDKHQKDLSELQAKLDELKQKHSDDKEKVAVEDAGAAAAAKQEQEKLQKQLDQLKKKAPPKPVEKIRVIGQRTENPRTTHLLRRGDFQQPGHEVQPGTLAVLHEFQPRDSSQPADRLDLARWLVSPENPLTPRVVVNRIWGHLFGRGLVRTMDDFGIRGELPTHPELLDWLAEEFLRQGGRQKSLIRTIVLSSTYRQASAHRPELVETDPLNDLFFRQNRFRVEGEIVRDLHLAASGLLNRKIGGPSVFPPMPADVAALSYANNFKWATSPGAERYRRGMYTFFKRTAPHPDLMTFDCPDSNVATIERRSSNTPLMALTTLNNEVYSEAAAGMAARLLTSGGTNDADRLAMGFRLCVVRSPSKTEQQSLVSLLEDCRRWYHQHPEEAGKLVGERKVEGVSPDETAAWAATARIIMNLDEFITRE